MLFRSLSTSAFVARCAWRAAGAALVSPVAVIAVPSRDLREIVTRDAVMETRADFARFLAMPDVAVRLIAPDGRLAPWDHGLSVHEHAALLARATSRPVPLALDREHASRIRPAALAVDLDYEFGCDVEGRLAALRARFVSDSGAYATIDVTTLERALRAACGPYRVSCVDVEAYAVCTNHPSWSASLGFDDAQIALALEACIERLAHKARLASNVIRQRSSPEAGAA